MKHTAEMTSSAGETGAYIRDDHLLLPHISSD